MNAYKFGFLTTDVGAMFIAMAIASSFSHTWDRVYIAVATAGVIFVLGGVLLMRQSPYVRSKGWKAMTKGPDSSKTQLAQNFLIQPGAIFLALLIHDLTTAVDVVPFIVALVPVALIVVGFFLAASDKVTTAS